MIFVDHAHFPPQNPLFIIHNALGLLLSLRLDHWNESLRGLNNPRGRSASVTNCIILTPTHEGFQTEERLVPDLKPTLGSAGEVAKRKFRLVFQSVSCPLDFRLATRLQAHVHPYYTRYRTW